MDFASIGRTFAEIHYGEIATMRIDSVEIEDDTAYVEVTARMVPKTDQVFFSIRRDPAGVDAP